MIATKMVSVADAIRQVRADLRLPRPYRGKPADVRRHVAEKFRAEAAFESLAK